MFLPLVESLSTASPNYQLLNSTAVHFLIDIPQCVDKFFSKYNNNILWQQKCTIPFAE